MMRLSLLLLCCFVVSVPVQADEVEQARVGRAVERHLPSDENFMQWVIDAERLTEQAGDRLEVREVVIVEPETVKLDNVVPPIRFESGVAQVPDSTVQELRTILEKMRHRVNVRLNLVGHTDDQPLSSELAKVYGDNEGLSRERAGQVAEFIQAELGLPSEAISYEWTGAFEPIASNDTEAGRALNRRVEVEVWYDELNDKVALQEYVVSETIGQIKVCRMETVCKLRYVDGHAKRARVQNLIAPLYYKAGSLDVTAGFSAQIKQTLQNLSDKQNVVVKFIGHTDELPLLDREERIYGDHQSLSKARARRVALAIQDALGLPNEAVDSDGRGASRAIASNATDAGRAVNRRIEVEFWYDDPLQELPNEPQLCPADAAAETVTRVYDPPWGKIPDLMLEQGQPVLPPAYLKSVNRALTDIADRTQPRLRFIGYTNNERLDRRTAKIYGDDIGLSAARARRVMDAVAEQLQLTPAQVEHEGRGYLHSNDVINAGFIQGDTSHVAVEVVYEELAVLDDLEGVDVTPITRELTPQNPFALNLMRITVDGEPIDDPHRSSADVQRCTDVALRGANIRFGFDNQASNPRLSVAANTGTVYLHEINPNVTVASPVRFKMYTNYSHFIERAEVRMFESTQSTEATPLAVVAIGDDGHAEWVPDSQVFGGPVQELKYVLRAYGSNDTFDETRAQALWVAHSGLTPADLYAASNEPANSSGETGGRNALSQHRAMATYGENALALQNIPLSDGKVWVYGSDVPPGQAIYVAGAPVPVDPQGNFVAEEILPEGLHTVEVAVLDEEGKGELYLRDLELRTNDWFYAGLADLTWSQNSTDGPADLLLGEDATLDYDSSFEGRLALYASGRFRSGWGLTTSIDTREGELSSLFKNFLSKSPDALFRRMDPDYHYPTFGDDGTVEELAPTTGKLYLKVSHDESYGLWGSFKVRYMNNELAQVDRGLTGGQLHYEAKSTTSFGEKKLVVDGFAAEPGTLASRQEFRGTGGSFYYLRHLDILAGSERVRIETRDKASGIVTGVVNLTPSVDYDIDYLQGTVLLSEPLASSVDDNLLVRSDTAGGDEAYLVVRYEYTPGFDDLDSLSVGGQLHYWLNDHFKVGFMSNSNDENDLESQLQAADLMFRLSATSWIKVQGSQSEGFIAQTLRSDDGGFGFDGVGSAALIAADAGAYRADISVGLNDVFDGLEGQLTLYAQNLEAGYSAPGLETLTDTSHYGVSLNLPITERLKLRAKADVLTQDEGVETEALELNVAYQLSHRWDLSTGVRSDSRESNSVLLATQEQGDRTDAVIQLGFDSRGKWRMYGFLQDTLSKSDTREDNGRVGFGGSYLVSDKLRVDAEASSGDLGPGGKVGTNYMHSERTSFYVNYVLENERSDNGLRPRSGSEGSLVTGMKMRTSDSSSIFLEERYRHGNSVTGLTHSTGVNLAPTDRFNLTANTDIGTLKDLLTGAETDRMAGGFRIGYGFENLQLSSGVEYRRDESEQLDASTTTRKTWLFRSSFKWQLNPSARLLGKLNYSDSDSSLGRSYAGKYTEAVLGYAFRPVNHDRLNALVKYTYFFNVPTTDQVTLKNTAAEFIQKSHVGAIDVTYDLTPNISIGGKVAYRLGQISLDRENPEFFDNTASLYVLRTDWRPRKKWEVLVETRLLDMPDLDEQRSGALVMISRYVDDHFKVGVGYNFTDFSDDLTNLSFDHQGIFLNVTGAF